MSLSRKTKMRLLTFVTISAAVVAGVVLFWTAQRVQTADTHLRQLQEDTANEKQSLHVLHAEWDYLNRPDRLEALAHERLNMVPPQAGSVVTNIHAADLAKKTPPAKLQAAPAAKTPTVQPRPAPVPANSDFQNMLNGLSKPGGDKTP